MKFAVIDIGSNSIGLLIAQVGISAEPIHKQICVTQLGTNVANTGLLQHDSMDRALSVIRNYVDISRCEGTDCLYAYATSVVRDAHNRDDFLSQVQAIIERRVEILSGDREAALGFWGVASAYAPCGIIDIGGASTELAWGNTQNIEGKFSLQMGAVRALDHFPYGDPPDPTMIHNMVQWAMNLLRQAKVSPPQQLNRIGIGGTCTTLAALWLSLSSYDPKHVEGLCLHRDQIEALLTRLMHLSLQERKALSCLEGRAETIVPSAVILCQCMDALSIRQITISDKGNKEGYLYELIR